MMKKILAAAVASAFAAPAFAATANVDIYGVMHLSVDSLKATTGSGATLKRGSGLNVSSNASLLGMRGSEDLGGGLSAVWQIETLVNGAGDTAGGLFHGQRDTFVGIKGGFGTVSLGLIDTPLKQLSRRVDFFNNTIGDTRNLLRSNATVGSGSVTIGGVPNLSSNAWEERFGNGIRWDSPNFSGLTASAHYSAQPAATQAANNNDTDSYSLGLNFAQGPFRVGAAYEKHNLTATLDEAAWRLAGDVTMGDIRVTALYHKATDQRGVNGADRAIYGLGAGYKMGANTIKAQYYRAGDEKANTTKEGAKLWAIGFDHAMSKRTTVYGAYAKASNDTAARFSMSGGGGHQDNLTPNAGTDPSGFSVGMIHRF